MKKASTKKTKKPDEMLAEYDFSGGVRGKYFNRYWAGTPIVKLDPDVAKIFKNPDSVNQALRMMGEFLSKFQPSKKSVKPI